MSIFNPPLPSKTHTHVTWGRAYGSSKGLALAKAVEQFSGLTLIVTPDIHTAHTLESELRFFCTPGIDVYLFPDSETLPYDIFSPHEDIISDRILALSALPKTKQGALIISAGTILSKLASKDFILGQTLHLSVNEKLNLDNFKQKLIKAGYQYVSQVMTHGEFTVRGSIIDLFPMGSKQPYRIDLFDDEIETIRTFNPETQVSVNKVDSFQILPAREFPTDEKAIKRFRQNYRIQFEGDPNSSVIYRGVSENNLPSGIEYYLPLFCEETSSFFDYIPENSQLVLIEDIVDIATDFENDIFHRYEQRKYDLERPPLHPKQLWISSDYFEKNIFKFNTIKIQQYELEQLHRDQYNFDAQALPTLTINSRIKDPASELIRFIGNGTNRILFIAESAGRREYLLEALKDFQISPTKVTSWHEFLAKNLTLAIALGPLDNGLLLQQDKIAIITESNLFGARAKQKRQRRRQIRDAESLIKNLSDLSEGSPVVHEDHGVGRFKGLKTLSLSGTDTEFLTLEYADGDILYVPVSSLHLVSRYSGASEENAPLHHLGGEAWKNIKRRAAKRACDVAAELLDIYSRREAKKGYQYKIDHIENNAFGSSFPYEETPDQLKAIEDVTADMESKRPMDRVVCGDVGFGKTEVAMRAAFIAANAGKQVAMLVPTTLLCSQHFNSFNNRFADWPIEVECLSRFVAAKKQKDVLVGLENGSVDIVIGTHKLFNSSIKFKNLGLVIVDEEQRFGVRQKEILKKMRTEVDILTLTATPIPRTLNMSLSGLRDLSIIATPPNHRLAIKTFVGTWNDNMIQEACMREMKRGGQVFFLHNEVKTIEKITKDIQQLLPDSTIRIAHGQMPEKDLEQVMLDFYHQRFNILVCTTIIENGIDIANANTIIINRADKLGLSQLHQIRGRVGRSHHRAYAYLIAPPRTAMTADSVKRLEAIESLEDLGVGFTLATHDLEIRGAGELLGAEQSGQIHEVGFTLYNELLARAVEALKAGEIPDPDQPMDQGIEVNLGVPALITDDYMPDIHARLVMYKRIASAKTSEDLDDLEIELIDRYGLLPEFAKNLFLVTHLKLLASSFGVSRIEMSHETARIHFGKSPKIDTTKILELILEQPDTYKLDGSQKLTIYTETENIGERIDTIVNLLNDLQLKQAA
jgi:transcription-repair coupling factor (superfamily II helicase)